MPLGVGLSTIFHDRLDFGTAQKRETGLNGYKTVFNSDNGALLMTDGNEDMGTGLVWPGDALRDARACGFTDRELCTELSAWGAKFSRLDLALDIRQPRKLTPRWFARQYRAGKVVTPGRGIEERRQDNAGEQIGAGVYLGSPSSDRRLRVYDKGLESATDAPDRWTRFELQTRRDQAKAHARAVVECTDTSLVVRQALRQFCVIDHPDYEEALTAPAVAIPDVPRAPHKTLAWLLDQTTEAAASYQVTHPNIDILELWSSIFIEKVRQKIR